MNDALVASVLRKSRESAETTARFFEENGAAIVACAGALREVFDRGGRLLVAGNGGSSCDAQHLALEHLHPVIAKRPALPAIALGQSAPFLSAVANDRDASLALGEEVRLLARPGDALVAISTSGASSNVVRALEIARSLGLLRVGLTGKDGGRLVELCDHIFVVGSYGIHRIQETHAVLIHVLWDLVHVMRGEDDVTG
ncbi:MAG: SIS domain-containing protein [Acidobacteriota bacterium]